MAEEITEVEQLRAEVAQLESKLNDAYYERDAARDDLARAEATIANLRGDLP